MKGLNQIDRADKVAAAGSEGRFVEGIRTRFTALGAAFCAAALLAAAPLAAADDGDVPRTASGRPDLTGTYDIATLTPLERDEKFSDNLYLSPEEAEEIANAVATRRADALVASDPTREAPPPGGDGSPGAAGNVGGYNDFWLDYGSGSIALDGKFRTSLVFDPPNGRLPKMKPAAQQARMAFFSLFRENTGTAWWLENEGPGPYDDMEQRPLGERCVLGFGSTSGPPMLPTAYNNLKRVVQIEDYVMILAEMIHDARIIRIGGRHLPGRDDELHGRLDRALGRRHPGCRDEELRQEAGHVRLWRGREPQGHGAFQPDRREHVELQLHGRGPQHLGVGLER